MTPVKQKAVALKSLMLDMLDGGDVPDISITQNLIATKHPASKGDINQIAFVPIQINKSIAAGIRLIDEIIEYQDPVVEVVPQIDDMIQDVCDLAYGRGMDWTELLGTVTRHYAMTAERRHNTVEGAAKSINMDRTTFRKYLS